MPTTTLTMVDGVRVVVPDSLDLITPYVLREQEDWFEDELRVVRKLLRPGQTVIDIGANYGVYALSMANAVGPKGLVLAFEPASGTARMLAESIAANGFAQVKLLQQAVSAASGSGRLAVGEHSELNALVRGAAAPGAVETVPLVTLDDCLKEHGWRQVDFVKIDAEGEEHNILEGGERFFAELSPLVLYEVKAGTELHLDLVQAFKRRGYDSYRLVPGLDLLVPFAGEPDGYLLNLFCCKHDQAERLAAQGRLLTGTENPQVRPLEWRRAMSDSSYAAQLRAPWERTMAAGRSEELGHALSLYWRSRDSSASPAERFAALASSLRQLAELCERDPRGLRQASLARIAGDFGARTLAVTALDRLITAVEQTRQMDPSEPFLPPSERFDRIAPGHPQANWVIAAALEAFERLSAFSSFYTGASALPRLQAIRDFGFASEEMQRRLALVQQRLR